jgi:PAS domain S-box-containing protein
VASRNPSRPGAQIAALTRKLGEYERWVRLLDAQIRVLERERQKLSAVVTHADAGFFVVDATLQVAWANGHLTQLLPENGPSMLSGASCKDVLCHGAQTCESCPAARAFRTGRVAHHEVYQEIQSRKRHLYATAMPMLSTAGHVDQAIVMIQDVSDLEVLRASEHRLRLLVEQVPAVMWSTDRELRFTSSVGAALAGLGLEPNEIVGLTLHEYFATDDPEFPPIAAHARAIRGESSSFAFAWQGRSFEAHVEPFVGSGSEIVGSVGIALDVTERTLAEEARHRSEVRKGAVLDTALDGIVSIDHRGRITEFNAAAERMFGHARTAALGRDMADLLIPESHREVHRAGLARHLATGEARVLGRRIELTAVRADGTEMPVELAVTRIPLDGPPVFTAYVRDLTERKQAEKALRDSEEQLRQAQKMDAIGTLAGGVAHDFNNLLTGILGHAQLVRAATEAGHKAHRSAEVIETAARRGAALTQQLLGFARKGKNQNVPVDLHATVHEVIGLLTRTVDKNIRMSSRSAVERPVVAGDPDQLQQVILNLAVNARDAMPDGGEMLFVTDGSTFDASDFRRPQEIAPGRYIVLSISDTGCGISEDVRRRIFEPFFTTKSQGKGTGMGLAMVYGIVKNHGGWVAVESALGRGTTVRVHLPQAQDLRTSESLRLSTDARPGTGRILVVDDEEIVRSVAEEFLRHLGYDVVTAADGLEAVEYYEKFGRTIDAVLLDMIMPRMGGRDCFRALREMNPDVRAVLSTGYGPDVVAQELLDEGMRGFVAKPYRLEQLADAVARALAG